MKSGPRLDGIVRSVDDDSHEFCGIEAAPRLRGGTSATKWLSDNAKLQKVLRDILSALAAAVAHERRVVQRLQVVGISTAGLACQVSRMCHRAGYVCVFTKETLNKIPDHIGQFKQLLLFLAAFAQVKVCVYISLRDRGFMDLIPCRALLRSRSRLLEVGCRWPRTMMMTRLSRKNL
jgi:hypothetical protein